MSAELSGHLSHPVTYTVAEDQPGFERWCVVETCSHHSRVVVSRMTKEAAEGCAAVMNGGHLVDLFDLIEVHPLREGEPEGVLVVSAVTA